MLEFILDWFWIGWALLGTGIVLGVIYLLKGRNTPPG
jgi:hypothetical protein